MKIILSNKQQQRGLVWLLIFFVVPALLLAAYFLWRLWNWNPNFDHTHGIGDPETNAALTYVVGQQWLEAQIASGNTNACFFIPELGVSGILDPLTLANPREVVRSSTNLMDWTEENISWNEACDSVQSRTNHAIKFYQRAIVW